MAFVRFYPWTFKQAKNMIFSKVHKILRKKGFLIILVHMCQKRDFKWALHYMEKIAQGTNVKPL